MRGRGKRVSGLKKGKKVIDEILARDHPSDKVKEIFGQREKQCASVKDNLIVDVTKRTLDFHRLSWQNFEV
jgi:hypothetical protein